MAVAQSEPAAETSEKLYEGMFLVDSGKFASNPDKVTQHLLEILEKAGATIVAHRPWQDGRLAYEIEGKRKGLHYLIYFRMADPGMPQIVRSCKLSEYVMRHLVIRQPSSLFEAMVAALNPSDASTAASNEEEEEKESDDEDNDEDFDDDDD